MQQLSTLSKYVLVPQKLDLDCNMLTSLPYELTRLAKLKELLLSHNFFCEFPISVLSGLTTLTQIDMSTQVPDGKPRFNIKAPLLPVLHPGLVELDLDQLQRHEWDPVSFFHLGRAVAEVADRRPVPTIKF